MIVGLLLVWGCRSNMAPGVVFQLCYEGLEGCLPLRCPRLGRVSPVSDLVDSVHGECTPNEHPFRLIVWRNMNFLKFLRFEMSVFEAPQ